MTYEEVKQVLNSYLKKLRLLKIIEQLLNNARQDSDGLKAFQYDKIRVEGGICDNVIERSVERILRYEKDYIKISEDLFDIEDNISKMLPILNEDEQTIIIERYMQGVSIRKISRYYNYSERHVYRIQSNAIIKIINFKKMSVNVSKTNI